MSDWTNAKAHNKAWILFKSAFARITLTPYTFAFFLLSIVHCIAQGLTASFVYSEDAAAFAFTDSIVQKAQVPPNEVARLFRDGDRFELKMCTAVPIEDTFKDCTTIFPGPADANLTAQPPLLFNVPPPARFATTPVRRDYEDRTITQAVDNQGAVTGVTLMFADGKEERFLSNTCVRTIQYPRRILNNSRREDLALIGSQFWLLFVSTFGLLYNSIPHICAVIFVRFVQTLWAGYAIWRTTDVQFRYEKLILGADTPCHFDILPQYFNTRLTLQIPELVLNFTALISVTALAIRLIRGYSSSTIRRVGPPPRVMQLYKIFLLNQMFVQLSIFFLVTASSMWIDQLRMSEISFLATKASVYYIGFAYTVATLVPWLVLGWISIRRELPWLMAVFLFISLSYLVGWGSMFISSSYKWTFIEWPFFACATTVAWIVVFGVFFFGIVSWCGFGRGLAHYLHVEAVLEDSDFDADVFSQDVEKKAGAPDAADDPFADGPVLKRTLSNDSDRTMKGAPDGRKMFNVDLFVSDKSGRASPASTLVG